MSDFSGAIGIAGIMGGIIFSLISVAECQMSGKITWRYFVALGLGMMCFASVIFAKEIVGWLT